MYLSDSDSYQIWQKLNSQFSSCNHNLVTFGKHVFYISCNRATFQYFTYLHMFHDVSWVWAVIQRVQLSFMCPAVHSFGSTLKICMAQRPLRGSVAVLPMKTDERIQEFSRGRAIHGVWDGCGIQGQSPAPPMSGTKSARSWRKMLHYVWIFNLTVALFGPFMASFHDGTQKWGREAGIIKTGGLCPFPGPSLKCYCLFMCSAIELFWANKLMMLMLTTKSN